MRILVDGLPLLGKASISDFLRQLLLHLSAQHGPYEYSILFRGLRTNTPNRISNILQGVGLNRFKTKYLWMPNSLLEFCWTRCSIRFPMTEVFLGQPDIFFSTVNRTPVARGIPIVSLAYDLIALRFPDLYGHIDPLLPERLRKTVERSAAIIAISECTKRDYVEILGADPNLIHVVYPGVESSFRAQLDEPARDTILRKYGLRQPYLLYVGTLAPHKNVETLVRVYKRLKERYNIPHYLVLCGQAQWGQKVVEAAKDLIAVRDCVVLDFIPSKDLPYVYHGAEAFVFLSLYEGFGLPPLEAMTCGIPVVASSASSLPEVVGDAGILVDPTDEGAIETELYRVLTDESLRQKMQAQGFQQAAHFSWSEAAEKILKVFNAVRCPR